MPWPTIDVDGKPTQLTRGTYRQLLADPDRETRRAVFTAFTSALDQFKNTQAALLKAGGSEDAYVLLKRAGFDAHDPAAYAAIGQRFEHNVDELEHELRGAGRLDEQAHVSSR